MPGSEEPSASQLYFRALRTEIIEAQKLRIQVGLAKTVFLGTLIGFFFKDGKGDPAILICPFVALMFDCMVYGLSFNIRDVGGYISEHLEGHMALKDPWQRHRVARVAAGFKDWGRIAFRVGSYGLSAAVSVLSFAETMPPRGIPAQSWAWAWRFVLIAALVVAWIALLYAEFSPRKAEERVVSVREKPRAKGQASGLVGLEGQQEICFLNVGYLSLRPTHCAWPPQFTGRETNPSATAAPATQASCATFTQVGIGIVLTRPCFPTRSTMHHLPSRC